MGRLLKRVQQYHICLHLQDMQCLVALLRPDGRIGWPLRLKLTNPVSRSVCLPTSTIVYWKSRVFNSVHHFFHVAKLLPKSHLRKIPKQTSIFVFRYDLFNSISKICAEKKSTLTLLASFLVYLMIFQSFPVGTTFKRNNQSTFFLIRNHLVNSEISICFQLVIIINSSRKLIFSSLRLGARFLTTYLCPKNTTK